MARLASRLGFVYAPDDRHYTRSDFDAWLPVLRSLGARWLTLRASWSRAVPEAFVQGLLDADIQPIIHIPSPISASSLAEAASLFDCYRRWGVRHVVVFDRPNQRSAWPAQEWGKTGLVERFLDRSLPMLKAQQSAGLVPVLPPLEPGGDYWDTAFLAAVLSSLVRRGQQALLRDLHLAAYAWGGGHGPDWGAGGPAAWPNARPYASEDSAQDHRGVRIFEWYAAIAQEALGAPLPTLAVAGGELPAGRSDEALAAHAQQNAAIAQTIADEAPASLVAFCFHLLTAPADTPEASAAWFAAPDQPLPVVDAYRRVCAKSAAGPVAGPRPLHKYILLPASPDEASDRILALAGKLARLDRATIGYSIDDACLASDVTLIGDALAHSKDVEPRLRAAGCEVRRLDPAVLEALPFDLLAASMATPAATLARQE
jgi:hypothetical protein